MTYFLPFLLLLFSAIGVFFVVNRPQLITIDARLSSDFPSDGFSHAGFEFLLQTYVDNEGRIDYARWHNDDDDLHELDVYLAAVAAFSPTNSPARFARQSDRLAYWLYSYNAYVIRHVLSHWPLDSVTSLKAPLEVAKGFGFFWRQRFLFGGEAMSLYAVENRIIRKTFRDPRIHFVLNCASESCPVMRPSLPTGAELEPFLASAANEFLSESRNVAIDHDRRRIVLSDIFKWYEKDFVNDLRNKGLPSDGGLIDYLLNEAPESMLGDLAVARDYEIEFTNFDWSINSSDEN